MQGPFRCALSCTTAHAARPVPTLPDDDQIERLAQLLEQRAVPFKGFNLEALDGYLSALVLSPEPVPATDLAEACTVEPDEVDEALEDVQLAPVSGRRDGFCIPEIPAPNEDRQATE